MKEIKLTQNKVAIIDDKDYEKISSHKWYFHRGRAVRKRTIADNKGKGFVWMHREICIPQDKLVVDHINGDFLDNRRTNLRICTYSENQQNQRLRKDSKTGYKNIIIVKKGAKYKYMVKFQSKIKGKRKTLFEKIFSDLESAIKCREEAAIIYHKNYDTAYQNQLKPEAY